jgi:N-methylhydantoinase A
MTRKTTTTHTALRIGVDTGGTFTDFIAIIGARQLAFKIPSTPHAPAQAILQGITRILAEFDGDLVKTTGEPQIVHGTTVATNALLERKGARTALLTTAGFEDVIEIGRQARPDLYNFAVTRPAPLVPSELRFGVKERIAPDGSILEHLNEPELAQLKTKLQHAGVESIAISLLFSFANHEHEQALAETFTPLGLPLSISHQILPEYREYERTSTVVINAYLAPRVSRYVTQLVAGLTKEFQNRHTARNPRSSILDPRSYNLRIMQSSGGSISAETAAREPVRTILSGPAGGVVAATRIAALAGYQDIISFDMGGTSTDVALCQGAPRTTNEAQITGLPVAVPVLDIHTVGAGGGSLAYIDAGGALRVGPESAGADPGPACYGKGTRPTVTDANCVLGRFAGAGLLSGAMKLDETRAAAVLDELAAEMSRASALKGGQRFTREQAALGVIRVANANMEGALRLVSIERGHDPRRFTLVSFGGAGGLHAAALAEALRIPRILIPAHPGAFSALGVLLADVVKDYSRTVMLTLEAKEAAQDKMPRQLLREFKQLEQQARSDLRAEGFTAAQSQFIRALAMRYRGQSFELEIALNDQADALSEFHRAHRARYGHADETRAVEIVSLRLRAVGLTEKPALKQAARARTYQAKPQRTVMVYLSPRRTRVPVYEREALQPGAQLAAPSIVIEYGSTTLIPAGWSAQVDRWHNLMLLGAQAVSVGKRGSQGAATG